DKAHLTETAGDLPQKPPAVAPKGPAPGLLDVAEELHHPALGGAPGQDGQGGKVGPQDQVAFFHLHKTRHGAAVEADPVLQGLGQVAGQHGDVFLGAKNIGKGKPDELDVVVLHKVEHILLGGVVHRQV